MPRRLLVLSLLAALSALSTGCCGRIRQCIANRWHATHPNAGCCAPAFKVPAFHHGGVGCSTCAGPVGGAPIVYSGPISGPAGVPTIGSPMPLLHGPSIDTGSGIPSTMPPKQ